MHCPEQTTCFLSHSICSCCFLNLQGPPFLSHLKILQIFIHHCHEFSLKAPFWILYSSSCVRIALCFVAPMLLSLGIILANCIHGCLSHKPVSSANGRDLDSLPFIYPLSRHQAKVLLYQGGKRTEGEKDPSALKSGRSHSFRAVRVCPEQSCQAAVPIAQDTPTVH